MTFKKYLYMIKKYLKNKNKTCEMCNEFYGNLRYEMPMIPYKKTTYDKYDFIDRIDTIEEQSEPWINIREYEVLDRQLEELMKEYNYM